ncbi:MAG: hypothetical protein FWH14_04300 [Oscillospiraceae bacterium]|nr:hypothetical protein [Oscillospiraceae bacterium]
MANTRNKVAIVFDGVVFPETPSYSVGIWILVVGRDDRPRSSVVTRVAKNHQRRQI